MRRCHQFLIHSVDDNYNSHRFAAARRTGALTFCFIVRRRVVESHATLFFPYSLEQLIFTSKFSLEVRRFQRRSVEQGDIFEFVDYTDKRHPLNCVPLKLSVGLITTERAAEWHGLGFGSTCECYINCYCWADVLRDTALTPEDVSAHVKLRERQSTTWTRK